MRLIPVKELTSNLMRVKPGWSHWTEESRFARLTCPSNSLLLTFNTGEVGTANQTVQDRGLPFLSFTEALIVMWAHCFNSVKEDDP